MPKQFEQFSLFKNKSVSSVPLPFTKKLSSPFPNILIECLTETQVRTNCVYYLRIINKTAQKRLLNKNTLQEKKIFFNSLLNELALKKGQKTPLMSCRDSILLQTLLVSKRK